MNEPELGPGRRCDVCQAMVPAGAADEELGEIEGDPPSLIEHRWTAHAIPGVTRCAHCGIAVGTGFLANHLSFEHNLPPSSDAQRAQYNAERIPAGIEELGDKVAEAAQELAG